MIQGENTNDSVMSVTGRIITQISTNLDTSAGKAILAALRHSIGRPLSDSPEVMSLLFENLPSSFLGNDKILTFKEKAVLSAIQLYALHQQGKHITVNAEYESGQYHNMGDSLRALRVGDDRTATDKRFNAMITSDSFETLIYRMRQLIKLLKSRTDIKIDYPRLAQDLYSYLSGYDNGVRISWSRSYYRIDYKGEKTDEK